MEKCTHIGIRKARLKDQVGFRLCAFRL